MGTLHPEIRKVIQNFEAGLQAFGMSDFHSNGIEQAREFFKATSIPSELNPPIYQLEERVILGPGGDLPIRIYHPSDGVGFPAMVWFHGGGFVFGDLDSAEFNCRKLANDCNCVVISVDYRLAPEMPFPGAIDDCYLATEWVFNNANDIGIDVQKIAVGGDSSGGNLAACVALRARDHGLPIGFQLLVYPAITDDFDTPSYLENGTGYILTSDFLKWCWDCYVPSVASRVDPNVSPIQAETLKGLPPA
ncbi:MAG: alpha/beta hydrolase, partial [Anaerolineales bacterium]